MNNNIFVEEVDELAGALDRYVEYIRGLAPVETADFVSLDFVRLVDEIERRAFLIKAEFLATNDKVKLINDCIVFDQLTESLGRF